MEKVNIVIEKDSNVANIITEDGGRKKFKTVSIENLIESFLSTKTKDELEKKAISDLYMEKDDMSLIQTIKINKSSKYYIIRKKKSKVPFSIHNTFYGLCGMPEMLFAINFVNENYKSMYVVVTDGLDKCITDNTAIYLYPFSNVSNYDGHVCTGMNQIALNLEYKENIFKAIDYFFSMPNTMESFFMSCNNRGYDFRQLITTVIDKEYPNEYLVKSTNIENYGKWISKLK